MDAVDARTNGTWGMSCSAAVIAASRSASCADSSGTDLRRAFARRPTSMAATRGGFTNRVTDAAVIERFAPMMNIAALAAAYRHKLMPLCQGRRPAASSRLTASIICPRERVARSSSRRPRSRCSSSTSSSGNGAVLIVPAPIPGEASPARIDNGLPRCSG